MFSYAEAFTRNLGWVTEAEQHALRAKRVAIAGLGGVGGAHVLTLTRLGIGHFNIADFDHFELHNFNRQLGANIHSVGRAKVDVMAEMALAINPGLEIRKFADGVNDGNVERFLDDVDLYIDGLDFFVLDERQRVFELCAARRIPAITAAPLGMGAALLVFLPDRMSFEQYFRMGQASDAEKAARFLVGLSPSMLQMGYLVDPSRVDLAARKGPSTPMACDLCAGIAATEALKVLLKRGGVIAAPWGVHFDAYKNRLKRTWRPGGNAHPAQRALIALTKRRLASAAEWRDHGGHPPVAGPETLTQRRRPFPGRGLFIRRRRSERSLAPATATPTGPAMTVAEQILDTARWAPSGDNSQPWRFEICSDEHIVVHASDTRRHCVYDLRGRASQLSVGALLESIRIAASAHGRTARIARRVDAPDENPVFDAWLQAQPGLPVDPLNTSIVPRSVQRRPLSTRTLQPTEKARLESAVGPDYSIVWFEGWRSRMRFAWLAVRSAKIRLTIPEAYAVHREVIEWGARYSEDRVPEQALGVGLISARSMRWAMENWGRISVMNRYFGGTLAPRLQLDLLPGLCCAAHFAVIARKAPEGIDDYVAAGIAVQRFWLTATSLGLQLQPQHTPLVFADYAREEIDFTSVPSARLRAQVVEEMLRRLLGQSSSAAVFLGRIGHGRAVTARSLRLPLERLRWMPTELSA
jgi:molybdopterin/thiamine biosynthesis adenylyltransferase/nitroreductase